MDGPVFPNGEWDFYWHAHLPPQAAAASSRPAKTGVLRMPSMWNGYEVKGRKPEGN